MLVKGRVLDNVFIFRGLGTFRGCSVLVFVLSIRILFVF